MSTRHPSDRRQQHKIQRCPGCNSTLLLLVRCDPPHHSRLDCLDCGRCGTFNPAPWTIERARAFSKAFGKFKGWTVANIAGDEEGISYLRWMAENVESNAGVAASIVLGIRPPDVESNPIATESATAKLADSRKRDGSKAIAPFERRTAHPMTSKREGSS